jgi:YD repeat-containing protein
MHNLQKIKTKWQSGRLAATAFLWLITFVITTSVSAQSESGVEDLPQITVIGTANGGAVPLAVNATVSNTFNTGYETDKRIINIIRLSFFEETNKYIPADFVVSIPVKIEYGPNSSSLNEYNQTFTVSYNKNEGAKYNAKNYFSFEGAAFVRITMTGAPSPASVGGVNMSDILLLENEMRVTRYFDLLPGVMPSLSSVGGLSNPVDRAYVSWTWPVNSGHTATELEWTWLENELETYYHVNGSLNYDLLFTNNATRVELPYGTNGYYVPLFYDGQGKLYYRARAVNVKADGSRYTSEWTTPQFQGSGFLTYEGHNNALNWQVRTSFAEEGKLKSVMEYYDGSLRSRQTVTKENVNNTTVTAETFYDYEGRPVIQILPTPGITGVDNIIQYRANLNLFNGQVSSAQNPAEFFDLSLNTASGADLYATAALISTTGTSKYYSPNNAELNTGAMNHIPDAGGYPYTVTRYTPDATGRVLAQSGVGPTHAMGSGKETKYYYGSPSQEELDGLFGTEVGYASHYFKNMVKDANGQMSVSYTDMHGRTVATALAGESPSNLFALNITDPTHYPNQAGNTITRNLLSRNTNVVKNNAIEAINTLLVSAPTAYNFSYSLAPDKLEMARCSSAVQLCYDCLYDLEISITDESGDVAPVVWKFSNVSLNQDDTCTTSVPALAQISGPVASVVGNTITFSSTLPVGSYAVRKTLTLSEASLQKYRQLYMQPGKGLCKTEQELIDSVYNVLIQTSDCNITASAPCDSCVEQLGTPAEFEAAYLLSLGNPTLTPALQAEIQAAYTTANENCNCICNTGSQLTSSKRQLMLADMMPYGGQYATELAPPPLVIGSPVTMFNKYNIFQTGFNPSIQPYYRKPKKTDGTALDFYRNNLGEIDLQIHPGETMTVLDTLSPNVFANWFINNWANAILPYHPEFPRLQYAEGTLEPAHVYSWINRFNNTNTYQQAVNASFLMMDNPTLIDSFYLVPGTTAKKSQMVTWLSSNYAGGNLSLWQIARGQVMCKNDPNPQSCFTNSNIKVPPAVFNGLSNEQKDQVWQAFRSLYASARDGQVNEFIKEQNPLTDDQALINQGYQLRFGSNSQTAQQYNWQWYPTVLGGTPPQLPPTTPGATYQGRCDSYINQWKTQLLECAALASHPQKDQILNDITAGMVSVCVRGSDGANPYGSSTVAPANISVTLPNSFEAVIYQVFSTYSINPNLINTRDNYFCNPYVIEFPKPYGKGPEFANEMVTAVDSCACANFDSLKLRLAAASVNYTQLTPVNNYLLANNMDTLTSVLHQALLNCSTYQIWVCDSTMQEKVVACYDPLPCDYMCAPRQAGNKKAGSNFNEANPLDCTQFQEILGCYFDMFEGGPFPYTYPNCQTSFVAYFNNWWPNSTFTWSQIDSISMSLCGTPLNVCTPCSDTILCAVDTNCRWVFNPYYLSSPQPLPDFLKCGGWPPQNKCMTCDSMVVYTTEFRSKFDPPINSGPIFTGTNLTPDQIQQNVLYAQFLNFRTGFQYTWMEYAQAAAATNCDPLGSGGGGTTDLVVTVRNGNTPQQYIASNSITFDPNFDHPVGDDYETLLQPNGGGGGSQTVLCRNNQPLNDTTGLFVVDTPCHRIRTIAISLAQTIYQQQQFALLANFERQYREKCMAAKDIEGFTVTYTNKEYHYTLYYYDMAGSLVKTVPPKGVHPRYDGTFLTNVKNARDNCRDNDVCSNTTNTYTPPHTFATNYRYNSLGQVVEQNTPDANTAKFWYDKLGRLVVSQNAQQYLDGKYSYTKYDALGRINEVGQKPHTILMTQTISQDDTQLNNWITQLINGGGIREQITMTGYDTEFEPNRRPLIHQQNLRNRVSYTALRNFENDPQPPPYYTGTLYTYDIHGNVDTLLQDYSGVTAMSGSNNTFKRITYKYDLISGKVNMVSYQPGEADAFYHKYKYDAENRLTEAYTSRDKLEWERDAAYSYYKHGPLSRTVLGQQQVQGIDYAYTIQGWLKGVNGTNAPTGENGEYDMGGDALTGGVNSKVAKDIYGYALHYYSDAQNQDYTAIGTGFQLFADPNNPAFTSLYNGNIGAMSVNNQGLAKGPVATTNSLPLFYNYRYDQLNRIRSMDAYSGLGYVGRNANRWIPALLDDYKETITYDPNGNIFTYMRNGSPSIPGKLPQMDDLNYNYIAGKNQLRQVTDNPAYSGNYTEDIDTQTDPNNYTYDAIGNLKTDLAEGIQNIEWTVYGKIASISKTVGGNDIQISYTYDASGNRITKKITPETGAIKTTVYVRDASGNVMSIYEKEGGNATEQIETHLYGSSRIGIKTKDSIPAIANIAIPGGYTAMLSTFTRAERSYELNNHLGNVLVTINDKKLQVSAGGVIVDYYTVDIVSATDYYPGGMQMPGRTYTIGNAYRYSINGQEKTPEIAPNTTTAEFWQYDARIVRRWNVDPKPNVAISPYNCFAGNPIFNIDIHGDTLSIGINQQSRDDITAQVSAQNQGFINLPAAGRNDVTLNKSITVGGETILLRHAIRRDRGLANLVDLINDTKNYFYNATFIRNYSVTDLSIPGAVPVAQPQEDLTADPVFAVGNRISTAVPRAGGGFDFYRTFENNSFTLRGDEATSLGNLQITPNKSLRIGYVETPYTRRYDGTIRIAPGVFEQHVVTATGTQINLVRSNIVYHELRENFYRVNGSSYAAAHAQAMLDFTGSRPLRLTPFNSSIVSDGDMIRSAANTTSNSTLIYTR